MAKSIRSKIKKRLRTAKRQRVDAMLIVPRLLESHAALTKVIQGRAIKLGKPKNAFKFPEADDAFFPQHEVVKPIDFRAQAMPMVGYAFRGNRRKYDPEQQAMMNDLAKNSHPDMEVLAGGGAVHAKTGKKVSCKEAELLATSIQKPEMSALAQQEAEEAADRAAAKAAFIAGKREGAGQAGDSDDEMGAEAVPEPTPEGAADHSRRPVVKDNLKQKRKVEGRARPNSASTNKAGKRMTNEDVQAALQSAMPKKPPAAAAAASAPPAAVAADATPAPAASAAASPKKKKGRKSGGGAAMDE